jgi:hypothetical protein
MDLREELLKCGASAGHCREPGRVKQIFIFFVFRQLTCVPKIKPLDSTAILIFRGGAHAKRAIRVNGQRAESRKIRD